jgi:hypothetical protein
MVRFDRRLVPRSSSRACTCRFATSASSHKPAAGWRLPCRLCRPCSRTLSRSRRPHRPTTPRTTCRGMGSGWAADGQRRQIAVGGCHTHGWRGWRRCGAPTRTHTRTLTHAHTHAHAHAHGHANAHARSGGVVRTCPTHRRTLRRSSSCSRTPHLQHAMCPRHHPHATVRRGHACSE